MFDHKKVLVDLIKQLISDKIRYARFEHCYQWYYFDVMASLPEEDILPKKDWEVFDEIAEKIDYTGLNIDKVDIGYGWITPDEFRGWVKEKIKDLEL